MEKNIVFIKQTHSSFSRGVIKQTTDTGDVFALHPNSFRFYYPRKKESRGIKGCWQEISKPKQRQNERNA